MLFKHKINICGEIKLEFRKTQDVWKLLKNWTEAVAKHSRDSDEPGRALSSLPYHSHCHVFYNLLTEGTYRAFSGLTPLSFSSSWLKEALHLAKALENAGAVEISLDLVLDMP